MSSLYWIRRDFRLDDNPALFYALKQNCKHAVYITAYDTWQEHNLSAIQADLIERHLNHFSQQLSAFGIEVTLLEANNFEQQQHALMEFCKSKNIETVFANSEPELRERNRDNSIKQAIDLKLFDADTILPYGSVLNKQGEMFKVFTPYKNAWLKHIKEYGFTSDYLGALNLSEQAINSEVQQLSLNCEKQDSSKWPLASTIMSQVVPSFLTDKVTRYADDRDFPKIKGTSGFSPYLAIGAISPKRLVYELLAQYPNVLEDAKAPLFVGLMNLFGEISIAISSLRLKVSASSMTFKLNSNTLIGQKNEAHLNAWQQGKTGFPIVDAAMRQLNQTGWMHNRLRMIVASFLTKHLLIDWRLGEAYFMQKLIDGDLAANSGGWQWAAGTGCDAQPYFRIFNPVSQSEKFDPDGEFIRKFIPELSNVPAKYIHQPHDYLSSIGDNSYWPKLVDLKAARLRALDYYKTELTSHDQ
jgi:deoxyribodipyrimidine photo-lyase